MNKERLDEALGLYSLENSEPTLIRHNENEIYRILGGRVYALRIHESSKGFIPIDFARGTALEQRMAEMEILVYLRRHGVDVQRVVRTKNNELVGTLSDGVLTTLLEWADGESMDILWPEGDIPENAAFDAGATAAEITKIMSKYGERSLSSRAIYGASIVPRIAQRLEKAREADALSDECFGELIACLDAMPKRMKEAEEETGLTVVHADLSAGNLVWNGVRTVPVDFSLSGRASMYADLASLLASANRKDVRHNMLTGWESVYGKRTDLRLAEPYYALFVMLFIACRYSMRDEWTWFDDAVDSWCKTVFVPLIRGVRFIDA